MVGKTGRVTSTIPAGSLGEVMVPVRGGTEAFNAYASEPDKVVPTGTRVLVIEYHPPRTIVVTPI